MEKGTSAAALERNLTLLSAFHVASSWLAWLPILALFIRESFGVDTLLTLSSIMYFGVVIAEVPSGWMSDRLGRVLTLRIATLLWLAAYLVLLVSAGSFVLIAAGQLLLAFGFAATSGTDVSLHYDTLEALGRPEEFEQNQARYTTYGYFSVSASAVAGGAMGLIDLRLAFASCLIFTAWQLAVVARLTEPPQADDAQGLSFVEQLGRCRSLVRQPMLRWIAGYWVAMVVLEHVAQTLAQPYITNALGREPGDLGPTPLVVGLISAVISFVGALAAAATPTLRKRLGFFGVLFALALLSTVIVTAMALVVSLAVLALMVFRSVHGASAPIVLTSAVNPLVPQNQRATYLSLHSLAGRVGYGSLLLVVGRVVGDSLEQSLVVLSAVSWILVVLIAVTWLSGPARLES